MSFLDLEGRTFLVVGVANRKSVAYHAARRLLDEGARVVLSVQNEELAAAAGRLFPDLPVLTCDLEREEEIRALADAVRERHAPLHGLLHSAAFMDTSGGVTPFHETDRAAFLRSVDVSCFSLVRLSGLLREALDPDASVVTVSISTTRTAAENYNFMAPVKAALDSAVCHLAKSFSKFSRVRFNSVNPGLLRTTAGAGIPGYADSLLFAEALTLRKEGVRTAEAADVIAFLLSPRSSGINAQGIVVDAGMSVNTFDADVVRRALRPE